MKARPRSDAYSPNSASWTLYKPAKLAEELQLSEEVVDAALEKCGFNKAVRIREEVIKWKTRLIEEQKKLHIQHQTALNEVKTIKTRQKEVEEMLINIRNILRIPREKSINCSEHTAFELLIEPDSRAHKTEQRLIVPANMNFEQFDKVLKHTYNWRDKIPYIFTTTDEVTIRMVMTEEDLEYNKGAVVMSKYTLAEFFPKYKRMFWTENYNDMNPKLRHPENNWKNIINLVRVIEEYKGELPYLND